jgi:hypothetical protein
MSGLLTCALSLFGYSVAATALVALSLGDFERVADRPRRPPGYSRALAASEAESEES